MYLKRKMLIFDTGIFQRLIGLNISDILFDERFEMINKGSIAEQYVGLELIKASSSYQQQNLFIGKEKH